MEELKDSINISNEITLDHMELTIGFLREHGDENYSKTHIGAIRILCLKLEYNFKRLAELSAQLKQSEQ